MPDTILNLSSVSDVNAEGTFCRPRPIRTNTNDDETASRASSTGGDSAADVDTMIAKELNSMSLKQREKLYEEIHGVESDFEETEAFLSEKLATLETELQFLVATRRGEIYERARAQNAAYVQDRAFRTMFLRAEYYDPKKAALRMVRFLKSKVKFFGEHTLTRSIALSDFDNHDMAYMKAGRLQLLPSRDHKGRAVLADMHMDASTKYKHIDNVIKCFLYVVYAAAEDEETQRRGLVLLYYFSAAFKMASEWQQRDRSLLECIPLKVVGFHFCANNAIIKAVKMIMPLLYRRNDLVKFRFHVGSHTEAQYSLMSFGTPVKTLPVTYQSDLKTANHHKWIARRQFREAAIKKSPDGSFYGVDLPGTRDILLGSGKTVQDHCGNLFLRTQVLSRTEEYQKTAKLEKNGMAMTIVQEIKSTGGRFLKRSNDVKDEIAREKVSSTFRAHIIAQQKHSVLNLASGKRSRISPEFVSTSA